LLAKEPFLELPMSLLNGTEINKAELLSHFRTDLAKYRNKNFVVPLGAPQLLLVYRADVLAALQVEPPKTWSELDALVAKLGEAKELKNAEGEALPWAVGQPLGGNWAAHLCLARVAGAISGHGRLSTVVNVETFKPLVDSKPFVEAFGAMAQWEKTRAAGGVAGAYADPEAVFRAPLSINGKTVEGKWTRALLDSETRSLFDELCEHPDVHRFTDVARVDVGIVTGANKYFLVNNEIVERYRLQKWAHPMFGRSEHCPGIIYDEKQHIENARKGNPTNFVWFKNTAASRDAYAKAYIEFGEEQKLHTRYKCRVRSPWYTVPSVYSTEVGMLKRCHDTPRLILNKIGAYTTDTAYRIRSNIPAEKLVGCFINPLTALSAEVEGRHYGGGVLELIPSEIERLMMVLPDKVKVSLPELDRNIRSMSAEEVLAKQGVQTLGALGLSRKKQQLVLGGWRMLRDRRHRTSSDEEAPAEAA
jgi:hypothetical protein